MYFVDFLHFPAFSLAVFKFFPKLYVFALFQDIDPCSWVVPLMAIWQPPQRHAARSLVDFNRLLSDGLH